MTKYQHFLLCLLCLSEARRVAKFHDCYFESIKMLNETSTIPFNFTKNVLKRSAHDHPKLFLEFYMTETLRNTEFEVKIFWSPMGNRRFILVPFKVARQTLCGSFNQNSGFTQRITRDLQTFSNIPYSEDLNADFCNLMPVGHYYVRNYTMNPSTFPSFTPTGRFRVLLVYYRKFQRKVLQTIEFHAIFT